MNRKQKERNIRKLVKLGETSLGLTLPIEMLSHLNWREKHRVVVKLSGKKFIISDYKPAKKKRG